MQKTAVHSFPDSRSPKLPGESKMYSSSIALRRNLLHRTQHLKPLVAGWRSQKIQAITLESRKDLGDSGKVHDHVRPFEEIPGPKSGLKVMVDSYRKSEGFTKIYKLTGILFAEYGPIYKENMIFGKSTVHVIDPEDFEKVFRAEGKYPRRPLVDVWVEYRKRRNIFPGLVSSDGEEWKRIRQTIAPKVMRPKIVEENIDNFNAVSDDAIARFVKLKEACEPDDDIPDLEGEVNRFTTESIGTVAFDARLGLYEDPPLEEALRFIKEAQDFFTLSHKLFFSATSRFARQYIDTPTLKKFFKCCDTIFEIGMGFVEKKRRELKQVAEKEAEQLTNNQVVPVLTYLLTKEDLTSEEVNGHAIDVVFAGVDTTTNTLLWFLYNLARFPDVQEELYQEIDGVVGENKTVTTQNISKLSYLKACLKESMRLTPISPFLLRYLDQDTVLSGYNVPADTCVFMELYSTARSEDYFKDPLEMKPERWLRENKNEIHAFSNLPFGFGSRMCLGRRVAELEMYVFVCKLLQRFRLEYHHEPLELYDKMVSVPDKPVKIKFVDRL